MKNFQQILNGDQVSRILLQAVSAGPNDGGCLIIAQALCLVLGGTVVHLQDQRGIVHHYGVMIKGRFVDANGCFDSARAWVDHFSKQEFLTGQLTVIPGIVQSEIPADEKASGEIAKLLKEGK
jgi:hypothetical protein